MPSERQRIDRVLAERGLFPSRTAAARAVRAGRVQVGTDGPVALRPSQDVDPDEVLEVKGEPDFVSRGGVKLSNALDGFGIDVRGLRCLDVGASTGGFTDCLLKRGAREVVALDVAYGQIDFGLRNDDRVTVIERQNARYLDAASLPFSPELAVIDVSFISLTKVLAPVAESVRPGGEILAMVKPQFELGRKRVGRGGVVRDPGDRREAVENVADFAASIGLALIGVEPTGLPGPKGNRETFLRLGNSGGGVEDGRKLCAGVEL